MLMDKYIKDEKEITIEKGSEIDKLLTLAEGFGYGSENYETGD